MIEVAITIHVDENPLQVSAQNRELIGKKYLVLADGMRAGVYFAKRGELALEKIPSWLPALKNRVKAEVEKVLKVKVKEVTIYR